MKKIILILIVASSIFSCKKELPSNIKTAVFNVNYSIDNRKENDSVILNLTTKEIDTLSKKTINGLLYNNEMFEENYKESSDELKEILKINPEYSDYEEVKNIKQPNYYKNMPKFYDNIMLLENRSLELTKLEYLEYNK